MEQRFHALLEALYADALRFQELYYCERKHIAHLDEQRCAGYANPNEVVTDDVPPAA